eukprot:UN05882
MMMGQEPRQTTSNIGHLNKPSIQALIHGLNRHYYSIAAAYRKNELELKMLMNLRKKNWMYGLTLSDYDEQQTQNQEQMENFLNLSKKFNQRLKDEKELNEDEKKVAHVGKIDPRKRLNMKIDETLKSNIVQNLGAMVNAQVF